MRARIGGYLGVTIGFLGWYIGFAAVCLWAGETGMLRATFIPCILISLGLALLCIIVLECVIRLYGAASSMFQLALWAQLTLYMGLLILLINHWIAPLIDQHPGFTQRIQEMETYSMSTVYKTPDTVPVILMAVGVVLLVIIAIRLLRDIPHEESQEANRQDAAN